MKLAITLFDKEGSVILSITMDMAATKAEAEQQIRDTISWTQTYDGAESYYLAGKHGQSLKSKIDKTETDIAATVRTVVRWFDYE